MYVFPLTSSPVLCRVFGRSAKARLRVLHFWAELFPTVGAAKRGRDGMNLCNSVCDLYEIYDNNLLIIIIISLGQIL